MRLVVLGPVVLTGDDGPVDISPRQARQVLTLLALAHPAPMSLDGLIDALWDDPPAAAVKTVQGLLSRLRGTLAAVGPSPPSIEGGPSGYRLVDVGEMDVLAVQRHADVGRRAFLAGAWTIATDALGSARTLFRERAELPDTAVGLAHQTRLDETRLGIELDHARALMLGGHHATAAAELELLTERWSLREHLWSLRMSALAHDGRVAEALRVHEQVRRLLADELGLEPGDDLRAAEREIVAGRLPALPDRRSHRPASQPTPHAAVRRPASPTVGSVNPVDVSPTRFVEVDDVHIAYRTVAGADPTPMHIVLVNPGALPIDCVLDEPHFARAIGLLSSFANVTWFDRRGIGLSDRCTAEQLPTTADWARDLIAVLDDIGADAPVLLASEDTTAVAFEITVAHPQRIAGIVLTNAYARFVRSDDYPYGLDPFLARSSVADVTDTAPPAAAFDLLDVIAPSMAGDESFRAWWDDAGHRGASPRVASALRSRHQDDDLRHILEHVTTPVLHLVTPGALAHDPGHDRHLESHLPNVTTVELPGRDELWWLDTSGAIVGHIERFVRRFASSPKPDRGPPGPVDG